MSLRNLLHVSYWATQPYILRGSSFTLWLVALLVPVAIGIVAAIMFGRTTEKSMQKFLARVAWFGFTMGFFGLVWLWMRQERVPFLAWRLWIGVWVIGLVAWATPLVKYALVRLPEIRKQNAERELKNQYLP